MDNSFKKKSKCRIIVDAMGGDFAPQNVVVGAVDALKESTSLELFLVGVTSEIKKALKQNNLNFAENSIIDAPEVISMKDIPTQALKSKPNSSISIGCKLVKEGNADAFVSAGNTGAMMAASTLIIGRIPGVGRPTMGAEIPSLNGRCFLFDVGAGKDAKAHHLLEYALMANIYASEIGGINNPTIGLLGMGEEDSKTNEVGLAAFKLLKDSGLNFIGNIEGRDILKGKVDIAVCDGFVGNILLKFGESVPDLLKYLLKQTAEKSFFNKIKIGLAKGVLKEALKSLDYQEQGGVPLLGVNGISIIGHGSSTAKAVKNMILRANEMHEKKLINKIQSAVSASKAIN